MDIVYVKCRDPLLHIFDVGVFNCSNYNSNQIIHIYNVFTDLSISLIPKNT